MLGQCPAFFGPGPCRFVPSRLMLKKVKWTIPTLLSPPSSARQIAADCDSLPTAIPLTCHVAHAHSDSLSLITYFLFQAKQYLKHRLHAQPSLQHFLLRNIRRPPCAVRALHCTHMWIQTIEVYLGNPSSPLIDAIRDAMGTTFEWSSTPTFFSPQPPKLPNPTVEQLS